MSQALVEAEGGQSAGTVLLTLWRSSLPSDGSHVFCSLLHWLELFTCSLKPPETGTQFWGAPMYFDKVYGCIRLCKAWKWQGTALHKLLELRKWFFLGSLSLSVYPYWLLSSLLKTMLLSMWGPLLCGHFGSLSHLVPATFGHVWPVQVELSTWGSFVSFKLCEVAMTACRHLTCMDF